MNISIAAYCIRAKIKNEKGDLKLDDVSDVGLFNLFEAFVGKKKISVANLEDEKVAFRIKSSELHSIDNGDQMMTGTIERGGYGYEAQGYDVATSKPSYKRKTTDAELLPFFFSIYICKNSETGVLLVQRFGNFGMFGDFTKEFGEYLRIHSSNHLVRFEPLILRDLVESIQSSNSIKKIRFRKYDLPADVSDMLGRNLSSDEAYLECSIVAKRGTSFEGLFKRFKKKQASGQVLSIASVVPDEVFVDVKINGKTRTMHMQDPGNVRPYYDVTNDVEINKKTGHPKACLLYTSPSPRD